MSSLLALKTSNVFTPLYSHHVGTVYNRCRIGNRDWVGHGINGCANYKDDAHFPFPAVRFKENTRDIWVRINYFLLVDAFTNFYYDLRSLSEALRAYEEYASSTKFHRSKDSALREKEKGDWKMLCCEEKKALYRASFCQTFAEFQHPTGQWKLILGFVLIGLSFTFWCFMFNHYYVWEPLPNTLSKASQKAQLRRMLEIRANPIDGISSKWDYDNDRWKK